MPIEFAKYRHFLKDQELTAAQEEQLLRAVAVVLEGCLDYIFLMHPAQQGEMLDKTQSLASIRKSIRKKYL
jgi:hypothetical protein